MQRYQPRLLAFCRHMLASREDAEDVLQEVFAAAFNAICADDRPINARPWLYRIARNRCLNHLRRPQHAGQDSMDVFEREGGTTTADTVHQREEFRQIVSDVQELPETQRTALLLREIDALTYEQIAEAMDTTVPSVKSLLVRARVALAEAAEARLLTCDEVRLELGTVAEGIARTTAPIRRHLKTCERCRTFKSELRRTSKALAAIYPIGPLLIFKKLWIAKLGFGGAASAAVSSSGGGAAAGGVAGAAAGAAGGITAGGAMSAGVSTLATKAAAGMAAAVIVTAGAVEVKHVGDRQATPPAQVALAQPAVAPATAAPAVATPEPKVAPDTTRKKMTARAVTDIKPAEPALPATTTPEDPAAIAPEDAPVQEDGSTVVLPPRDEEVLTQPGMPPVEPAPPTTEQPPATPAPQPPATAPTTPPAPPSAQTTPPAPAPAPDPGTSVPEVPAPPAATVAPAAADAPAA